MGNIRTTPLTTKDSLDGSFSNLKWGMSAMCGWRLTMEDAHIMHEDTVNGEKVQIFGIFDGHGGPEVAKYVDKYFFKQLQLNENYKKGVMEKALQEVFLKLDELLMSEAGQKELREIKAKDGNDYGESMAGCTANVCLIYKKKIYCSNAGDSRSVLCITGEECKPLSKDHKPDDPIESQRITKANGYIIEGRVNGNLNLSRAIGDLEYKKDKNLKPEEQMITAFPDVEIHQISEKDSFIVMGCDGIWESMTNKEICDFFESNFKSYPSKSISAVVEEFLDKNLATDTSSGIGCDNMSCIVVKLCQVLFDLDFLCKQRQ